MYAVECDSYLNKGISVIPADGKKVIVDSFGQYSFRIPKPNEINYFKKRYKNKNIGLMMGPVNNLMCIDVDTNLQGVMKVVEDEAPKTPVAKFGSKGITKIYRMSRKTNNMFVSRKHGCMLEFLCTSKYTIIPPSIHPNTGAAYKWIGGNLLDNLDEIPEIEFKHLKKIEDYMRSLGCEDLEEIKKKAV